MSIFNYLESKLDLSLETDEYKDFRFVKWLAKNVKLQGIPFSAFYSRKNKYMAENYLRFCFFKVTIYKSFSIIFIFFFAVKNKVLNLNRFCFIER